MSIRVETVPKLVAHARNGGRLSPRLAEVLVAEDDEAAAELIVDALRPMTALTVGSGEEALRYIRSTMPISLLITSLELPGRYDGVALARQARALQPDLKIIYTTAYGQHLREDDHSRYYGELLHKPLTAARVRAAVSRAAAPAAA
jgi:CheY-like chemotaxis protein